MSEHKKFRDLREFLALVEAAGELKIRSRVTRWTCFEHLADFPKVAQTSPECKKIMMEKYGDLIREIIGRP